MEEALTTQFAKQTSNCKHIAGISRSRVKPDNTINITVARTFPADNLYKCSGKKTNFKSRIRKWKVQDKKSHRMKLKAGNLMLFLMRTVKFSAAASRAGLSKRKIKYDIFEAKKQIILEEKQLTITCTEALSVHHQSSRFRFILAWKSLTFTRFSFYNQWWHPHLSPTVFFLLDDVNSIFYMFSAFLSHFSLYTFFWVSCWIKFMFLSDIWWSSFDPRCSV